ncbi:nitrogen regulation protein NR(I) [Flocculibacter collagenilyticus]|uniref:nitrogen regulation protein NR(I) n=1 Tax=Flocculibacter collagenilyticus TaxID=2744479 RepID=UPI0018F76E0D|nr:nitrogen regulation protein NR(I) [Flocculibacter collagenilyticus]
MMQVVWVVDDDSSIRWVLEKALKGAHIHCESFVSAELMLQRLAYEKPDAIVSDVRMPKIGGLELIDKVHSQYPHIPIIIMTAHSDLDSAVNAYKHGAFEYLPKPFDIDEAIHLIERAFEHSKQCQNQPEPNNEQHTVSEIIGEAPAMQEVFRAIGRLSRSTISVLINGQSGTGKELVASALHKHSPRAQKTFIALNMAAIPKDLIESELFGHEKGAFTGAATVRRGRFEQADGGTLFLDEIGDMPLDVQTRLLRVLAEGQFYRVGGHEPRSVDVRIIAATHQNLELLVHEGKFREDLFHRLNVIRIHLPSLAERREDIPALISHFLKVAAKELNVEPKSMKADTLAYLSQLTWPGNVRQLENTCRWLTVMASSQEVHLQDLPQELQAAKDKLQDTHSDEQGWQHAFALWVNSHLEQGHESIADKAQEEVEKILIDQALHFTRGHKQEAAKKIGWGRNTLTRKLQEHSIATIDLKNLRLRKND